MLNRRWLRCIDLGAAGLLVLAAWIALLLAIRPVWFAKSFGSFWELRATVCLATFAEYIIYALPLVPAVAFYAIIGCKIKRTRQSTQRVLLALGHTSLILVSPLLLLLVVTLVGAIIDPGNETGPTSITTTRVSHTSVTSHIVAGVVALAAVMLFLFLYARLGRIMPALALKQHVCPECQYQLKGLATEGCPECGWNRER